MPGLLCATQNDQMAARYEYEALKLREKSTGGRLSGDKQEEALDEHAAQGGRLKFLTRSEASSIT